MAVPKTEISTPLVPKSDRSDLIDDHSEAHTVRFGWILAVSASVSYSVATPVARAAILSGFDPNALLVARMVLATSLLLLTMLVTNRRHIISDRRCFLLSFGAGALNGFGMICYFQGLTLIESSMAAMIITMSPLVVLTLLALRGERFTYRHFVRLGLALVGAYLLIGPGGEVNLIGVAFVMVAILSFALQLVLIQWFLRPYPARSVTFYQLIAMTIAVVGWWWWQGAVWVAPGPRGWLAVIVLAVFSTYAARLLTFGAVSRIGGGQMSLLAPLETLLAVLWSILFLGERLSPLQWIGGTLILISAMLAIKRINIGRWRPRWRVAPRT